MAISIVIFAESGVTRDVWSHAFKSDLRFEVLKNKGQPDSSFLRESKPELILLDIKNLTKGVSSMELARKCSPGSKVLCVSAEMPISYVKKMLKMGARGYVISSYHEVLDAIMQIQEGGIYVCSGVKNTLSEEILIIKEESGSPNPLTEREIDVINLLKEGYSSREIAGELKISTKTVEVHRHHILKKLKAKNTASLINCLAGRAL